MSLILAAALGAGAAPAALPAAMAAPAEAGAAAAAFRRIADGDRDGRVTPIEYRQARDFILAR